MIFIIKVVFSPFFTLLFHPSLGCCQYKYIFFNEHWSFFQLPWSCKIQCCTSVSLSCGLYLTSLLWTLMPTPCLLMQLWLLMVIIKTLSTTGLRILFCPNLRIFRNFYEYLSTKLWKSVFPSKNTTFVVRTSRKITVWLSNTENNIY